MNKNIFSVFLVLFLSGCGGSSGNGESSEGESSSEAQRLSCNLNDANLSFQDQNPMAHSVGGKVIQGTSHFVCNADQFLVRWDQVNDVLAGAMGITENGQVSIVIPANTALPTSKSKLNITPMLGEEMGLAVDVEVLDLVSITGPGGNVKTHWEYGTDRQALMLAISHREQVDYCQFDNGNVLVHDSEFRTYVTNGKGVADDLLYPAYEFDCTNTKINLHRPILWANSELGQYTHTYSTINDAMHYGNITFNVFEKYLNQRPFERLRIRVHHGNQLNLNDSWANWNGAYINLNDATYHAYGMASLDTIAHEAAHGILQNHSALKHAAELETQYTPDARTLHEAYSDMASVAAHYEAYGELSWDLGEENFFYPRRSLNKIETEPGAILSYLDYQAVKNDKYKKIGIMTYPFYVLSYKWSIEKAFQLFTDAALSCWQPTDYFLDAARCVKETAATGRYNLDDVIHAFREVKLKLQAEDTLAHYTVDAEALQVQFHDLSETDRTITHYRWDFGDGQTSTQASPYHEYAVSGNYVVTLEIEDNLGVKDSLTRVLDVSD